MYYAAGSYKKFSFPARFIKNLLLLATVNIKKKLLSFLQIVKLNLHFPSGGLF